MGRAGFEHNMGEERVAGNVLRGALCKTQPLWPRLWGRKNIPAEDNGLGELPTEEPTDNAPIAEEDPEGGAGELEAPAVELPATATLVTGEVDGLPEEDAEGTTTAEEEEEGPGDDPRLPVDVPMEV